MCRRAEVLLDRWSAGAPLETADLARLDAHLAACPSCASGLADRVALQQALRELAERETPPAAAVRRTRRVADVLGRVSGRRPPGGQDRRT
jgi:anti-sigma factor RsiW